MTYRKADAVLFGFDFQVNAAIVIMLENIRDLNSVRFEGESEDIEIELSNGECILAQAKSVVKSSTDFINVRSNLKKALHSLSEGNKRVKAEKLILITNSSNPLNENVSRNLFWGTAHRAFDSLPATSQKIINDYLGDINDPLDVSKFSIQILPFETDDARERYKAVMQTINDFVGDIKLTIPGLGKKLHEIWREDIFINGTKNNSEIRLTKKELIWPIIVLETDTEYIEEGLRDQFDPGQYDEIVRQYKAIIDSCCEHYEFFTKVLYDYKEYGRDMNQRERTSAFVLNKWKEYSSEFNVNGIDSETLESLTRVILYNIIRRRHEIERIKQGVNL